MSLPIRLNAIFYILGVPNWVPIDKIFFYTAILIVGEVISYGACFVLLELWGCKQFYGAVWYQELWSLNSIYCFCFLFPRIALHEWSRDTHVLLIDANK